jgi:hypothetical protein
MGAPRSPRSGARSVPDDATLREVRIPFVQRAVVEHGAQREELFTFDVGLRGLFVERSEPLPRDVDVRVHFRIPGNEIPVEARCRVAWWHAPDAPLVSKRLPAGNGLEFRELEEADLRRLRAHILEHLQGDPRARRFQRPWPQPEEDLP